MNQELHSTAATRQPLMGWDEFRAHAQELEEKGIFVWYPLEGSQEDFVSSWDVYEVLYEGTRGPGKTNALLQSFAIHIGIGFGAAWKGIIFRKTYPELKDIIAKSQQFFPRAFPGKCKFNITTSTWEWSTGERLIFAQFAKETDYLKYHGHEYPFIGWEELTTHSSLVGYKKMLSCCRAPIRDFEGVPYQLPLMIRSTTNPYGPGHNLVKQRFKLPESRGLIWKAPLDEDATDSKTADRLAIYGHISENRILLKSDPDYIHRVASAAKNDAEKRAWVSGDWNVTSGGMFDDIWRQPIHVVRPFAIPPEWRLDRSFDWGSARPFAVLWWAESNGDDVRLPNGKMMSTVKGDLFCIGEWYGAVPKRENEGLNLTNAEITQGIVEREIKWGLRGRVNHGPADSAINNENASGTHVSIAMDMAKPVYVAGKKFNGVKWVYPAKGPGSRKSGWQTVRERLKQAVPPERGIRDKPGLFFFSTCENVIRLLPTTPRDEKDLDDVDTDTEDHIQDAVRYKVVYKRPRVGSGGRDGT